MKHVLFTASLIAMTSASGAAFATTQNPNQVFPHWYVGIAGGVTYLDDSDISGTSTGEMGYDTGWTVNAALGYTLPYGYDSRGNVRLELEASYRENSLDNTILSGVSAASPGRARIASYMVNGFYDFRNQSSLTPYIGGGFGLSQVGISHDSGLGNTGDDEDTVMAYQGMAGIAYAPMSMPNTEWTLGYRYFTADSPEYTTAGGKVKLDDLTSHSAEIGGRFKF
ncbi:MAG: outer membrane protein [Alphaproteobacteria bacterium]